MYLTRMLLLLIAVMFVGVVFINVLSATILKIMTSKQYFAAKEFIPWLTIGFLFQRTLCFLGTVFDQIMKNNGYYQYRFSREYDHNDRA